jgi:hypothetical protein
MFNTKHKQWIWTNIISDILTRSVELQSEWHKTIGHFHRLANVKVLLRPILTNV